MVDASDNIEELEPSSVEGKETTLRRYRFDDIPLLVKMAQEEIPKLPNHAGEKIDPKRLTEVLVSNLTNDGYIMVRLLCDSHDTPVGVAMGYCVQKLYSYDYYAGDIFLFVQPEYRSMRNAMKLIRAFKEWGLARGADPIIASYASGHRPEQMHKLMTMIGFEEMGKLYYLRKGK